MNAANRLTGPDRDAWLQRVLQFIEVGCVMRCSSWFVAGLSVLCVMTSAALAADFGPEPVQTAQAWSWDVGARYWYSTGKNQYSLFDSTGAVPFSRLTYDDLKAHSGETFFRVDHLPTHLFLKGYIGAGVFAGGKLTDEDFPTPLTGQVGYSNTTSQQDGGNLRYFTVDIGYTFYDSTQRHGGLKDRDIDSNRRGMRLGAFVGYNYWNEKADAFGCVQNIPGQLDGICLPAGVVGPSELVLSESDTWRSLRLGLTGDMNLTQRLKLTGDVAYLRSQLDAVDTHHLPSPAQGDNPQFATGNGVQADALLSYQLSDLINLGVGARWWHIEGDGGMHFAKAPGASAEAIKFDSERYGVFVQGSLKLN